MNELSKIGVFHIKLAKALRVTHLLSPSEQRLKIILFSKQLNSATKTTIKWCGINL